MTYPNLLTTDEKADLEDREELQAYRDGLGQLAEDPMHAGQPVHVVYGEDGEPAYWLQVTHQGHPLWSCQACSKLTVHLRPGTPDKCVSCGAVDTLTPLLYETSAACLSWSASYGGQYDGECLIAGTDGCDCPEAGQ
jgi:hypothetical protein